MGYIYLFIAIVFEVIGVAMLKLSEGFTNTLAVVLLVICYGISFTLFIIALKSISLSVGYSIWSGLGTVGSGAIGMIFFHEALSFINMVGLVIIIAGVVLMNIKSAEKQQEASV